MTTIDVLKAVADETRLRMLSLLVEAEELCGCEIEAVLRVQQSNASRHLARLRAAGVISATKHGQWVHYAFRPSSTHAEVVSRVVEAVRTESDRFTRDLARLRDYRASGFTCETIRQWEEARARRPAHL
ncbi:MAG: ArsR/SmtB family transcription factor [Spirochaetaceae bacterium]